MSRVLQSAPPAVVVQHRNLSAEEEKQNEKAKSRVSGKTSIVFKKARFSFSDLHWERSCLDKTASMPLVGKQFGSRSSKRVVLC